MLSTVVFSASLFGLSALFCFKALEISRHTKTPLTTLRRVADPILTEGLAYCTNHFRAAMSAGLHVSVLWLGTSIRKIEVAFYVAVHGITARLNRYLRMRRLHIRHGSEVSTHLKTVLEKADKSKGQPDSL